MEVAAVCVAVACERACFRIQNRIDSELFVGTRGTACKGAVKMPAVANCLERARDHVLIVNFASGGVAENTVVHTIATCNGIVAIHAVELKSRRR